MKGFGAFVLGTLVGAAVLVIVERIVEARKSEDAEALSDRIARQLAQLEKA